MTKRLLLAVAVFAALFGYLVWSGSDHGLLGKSWLEVMIVGIVGVVAWVFFEFVLAFGLGRKKRND